MVFCEVGAVGGQMHVKPEIQPFETGFWIDDWGFYKVEGGSQA
jgi:hypothetical protein